MKNFLKSNIKQNPILFQSQVLPLTLDLRRSDLCLTLLAHVFGYLDPDLQAIPCACRWIIFLHQTGSIETKPFKRFAYPGNLDVARLSYLCFLQKPDALTFAFVKSKGKRVWQTFNFALNFCLYPWYPTAAKKRLGLMSNMFSGSVRIIIFPLTFM